MSTEFFLRCVFAFVLAAALGWAVYDRAARETNGELTGGRQRYVPYLPPVILPLFVVWLFVASCFVLTWNNALHMMLSLCFGIFLHMSVYYAVLLLLLPLLRKVISARACAVLWLLPNYLYITQQSFMEVPSPKWVLRLNGNWIGRIAVIWLCGFVAVLGWKLVSHLLFRRRILKDSRPVTEPDTLALWQAEQRRAAFRKQGLQLVISPAVTTPLSIGFFRRTLRVVLPERDYTAEELALIFRHEIVHIGREDSGTKFFLVFCTAMCWFNPLMWLAMRRSADDLELSCDETVLLDADESTRSRYAQLLLTTAGDERGFTTCLSASAAALRYRLGSVIKPRKRLTGGILAGLIFFGLIVSCGYTALAYDGANGQTYIFTDGSCGDYTISSISRHEEDVYRFYTCTNEAALGDYLASLPLYHMTGNFDSGSDHDLSIIYQGPDGLVCVTLWEDFVSIVPFGDKVYAYTYYCPDTIDWDYLDTLLA